jgi:hypothetical protein
MLKTADFSWQSSPESAQRAALEGARSSQTGAPKKELHSRVKRMKDNRQHDRNQDGAQERLGD